MGWERPIAARENQPRKPRTVRPRRVSSPHGYKPKPKANRPDMKPEPFIPAADTVIPLNLGVLQLTSESCHWPYGDDAITFCGHPSKPGCPYCPSHAAIAYQKPRKLTRKAFHEQQRRSQRRYRADAIEDVVEAKAA